MNFIEAMRAVESGSRVRRACWLEDSYLERNGATCTKVYASGLRTVMETIREDVYAEDWTIHKDERELLARELFTVYESAFDVDMRQTFEEIGDFTRMGWFKVADKVLGSE